jgi:HD-like signal output (HDOD) protein
MRHVLLVEDDARELERLRTAMATPPAEWQFTWVNSGAAALAELARHAYDAVVSDLHMPQMDGMQLLAQVQDLYPHLVRLCMSEMANDEDLMRAMPVAHQFLSKPCNPDQLFEVLERACSLRDIMQHPVIREVVGRLKTLPVIPTTFQALTDAIARPNAHSADIAGIVSKDTALCVKVLQIVNSAFFRRSTSFVSIQAAISYLGLEMIRTLALLACVYQAVEASPLAARSLHDMQTRSLRKAQFARMLLKDSRHADEAFTAALLLDIGHAVLALGAPAQFEQMAQRARASGLRWHEVEPEVFGVAHTEVGAYLLGLWGLPADLIQVVAFHHLPSLVQHTRSGVLAAVHVADAVIDAAAEHPSRIMERLDGEFVARSEIERLIASWHVDIEAEALEGWRQASPTS